MARDQHCIRRFSGYVTPTRDERVRLVLGGIRRRLGTAQDAKAPAVTEDVLAMLADLPLAAADVPLFVYRRGATLAEARPREQALLGLRDRALLLVGFGGAFRRSELVLTLRRSKTDQEAAGELKAIPYCERLESCPARAPASRSATSCARPASVPSAWCASTSARVSFSATTRRAASDSEGNRGTDLRPMSRRFAVWRVARTRRTAPKPTFRNNASGRAGL
jgi:hypothetical protein